MNSDLVHSIVQDGPKGQRPKAHHQTMGAEELHSEKALTRTLLEPNILKQLVTEVRETVATDVEFSKARKNTFSTVKLWNIRRNSRYAAHARNKKPRIVTGIGY